MEPIVIVEADYAEGRHGAAIVELLDEYARGESGGGQPLAAAVKSALVPALARCAGAVSLIAYTGERAIGLLNAFETLSTFRAQPLLNIHDLAVTADWRGRGVARALLQAIEQRARTRGCCKLTLEVLEGNAAAQKLYRSIGFSGYSLKQEFGEALFWQKLL